MAAPKFDRDRAAKILIDAAVVGDATACEKWGISRESLRRYRARLDGDPELSQAIVVERRRQIVLSGDRGNARLKLLEKQQATLSELAYDEFKRRVANKEGRYSESELREAIARKASDISRTIGFPAVVSVEQNVLIGSGNVRADLVFHHSKKCLTIVEVKSCQKSSAGTWLLYPAVGQILYYKEIVCDRLEVKRDKVNMAILSDYDPDMYFLSALNQVKERIYYLNTTSLLV